jgi:predicted O-methyltransferase YrrM
VTAGKNAEWYLSNGVRLARRAAARAYRETVSSFLELAGPPEFLEVWDACSSVAGFTKDPAESLTLYTCAGACARRGAVVELGSYLGRSTAFLAAGVRRAGTGRVVSVDPHRGGTGDPGSEDESGSVDTLPLLRHNLRRVGLAEFVVSRVGTAARVAAAWTDGPVSMLFVDGLHTYDAVVEDVTSMRPHLLPGAIVVVDDVHSYELAFAPEFPDVRRALRDLVRQGVLPRTRVRVNRFEVFGAGSLRDIARLGPGTGMSELSEGHERMPKAGTA